MSLALLVDLQYRHRPSRGAVVPGGRIGGTVVPAGRLGKIPPMCALPGDAPRRLPPVASLAEHLAEANHAGVSGPHYHRRRKREIVIMVSIADRAVLVTGANRGIGQALVEEALRRGAKRVYAGTRQPLAHPDGRVTPLPLDVTSAAQIQAAAGRVESLDVLINNAGLALYDDLSDRAVLEQHLAVNLFGTYGVTQAFLPLLTGSRGAIVNNVSMMAFAPLPLTPAYALSKAAAFNLTQSLRALLAGRGVRVHAVLTGPTDTDMTRGFEIPKASPESVARAIFDGVEKGEEDIFPDPASGSIAESWLRGPAKSLERAQAAFIPPIPDR